LYFDIGKGRSH